MKDSSASLYKPNKKSELKPTELVPQHLVDTTPGPWQRDAHLQCQTACSNPGALNNVPFANPSPMDLGILGGWEPEQGSDPNGITLTRVERTVSKACKRTAAFWSKGEDLKVQRNPKHLSSSVQAKGEIDSERTEMKQNIISDRLHCLITGWNDNSGKGYKASYFGKHIYILTMFSLYA